MPTLVRGKPAPRRKSPRKQASSAKKPSHAKLRPDEIQLDNAIGAAAARDLAARSAITDPEEAALVNAVARAAARSLAS